jgi:UDPglucose 6-dehydrogenase
MKITMIGTGYVGLVTGACLADVGHDVICVDKDRRKIEMLHQGRPPIYEPGLEELVHRNAAEGRLRFSLDLPGSVAGRDAVFIAVGTPADPKTGDADLSFIFAAAAEVAANIDQFTVVVTKSTVPVGTNRRIMELMERHLQEGVEAAVASNPEFLREGAAISDFMEPDRVVIGADDERANATLRSIYAPFEAAGRPLLFTGLETAEMVKYAANAFLAVKLSYINEIADLCEVVNADVSVVAKGLGLDPRIGAPFLQVGPGWGGSCFPKDTLALQATARRHGLKLRAVDAAVEANVLRKASMVERIAAACGGSLEGKRIGLLGLTFKGQTDDMRDSPSLDVVPALLAAGAEVQAYDPAAPVEARILLPDVEMVSAPVEAARDADALVVLTDWLEFAAYDLAELADAMADPVMVDLRNLLKAKVVLKSGFRLYVSLGRAPETEDGVLGRSASTRLNPGAKRAPIAVVGGM